MKIGDRLKKIRRIKGLSQQELADHSGVKRSTVAKIERDDQRPPLDFLISFATLCNMTLDDLIDINNEDEETSYVEEEKPAYGGGAAKEFNVFQSIHDLANSQDPFEKTAISQKLTRAIGELMEENAKLKTELIEWLKSGKS